MHFNSFAPISVSISGCIALSLSCSSRYEIMNICLRRQSEHILNLNIISRTTELFNQSP